MAVSVPVCSLSRRIDLIAAGLAAGGSWSILFLSSSVMARGIPEYEGNKHMLTIARKKHNFILSRSGDSRFVTVVDKGFFLLYAYFG